MKKKLMTPGTINTILNTAPMLIQGASKLVQLIRERGEGEENANSPDTLDGLRQQLEKIESRLDANDEASLAQVKLIEELARQNEALAGSLKKTMNRLTATGLIAALSFLFALAALFAGLR